MFDSSDSIHVVFHLLLKIAVLKEGDMKCKEVADQGPKRTLRPRDNPKLKSRMPGAIKLKAKGRQKEGLGSEKGRVSREIRRGSEAGVASI